MCDCGSETFATGGNLRSGNTSSCGCYKAEIAGKASITHGMRNTQIYRIWDGMIYRCTGINSEGYHNYGGRGITVCDEWKKFENFYADMGDKPEGLSLDRIDNDGPYCRLNCRWTTPRIQATNRRTNVYHEFEGVRILAADFAEKLGVSRPVLSSWRKKGLTDEQIIARADYKRTGAPMPRNIKPLNLSEFANLPYLGRL